MTEEEQKQSEQKKTVNRRSWKTRARESIQTRKKTAKKKIKAIEAEKRREERKIETKTKNKINKELEKLEAIDKVGKTVLEQVKSNIVSDKEVQLAGTALNNIVDNEEIDVVFRPNEGPQTQFLAASEFQILYGGAAGGRI